jgi:hypothetical protein
MTLINCSVTHSTEPGHVDRAGFMALSQPVNLVGNHELSNRLIQQIGRLAGRPSKRCLVDAFHHNHDTVAQAL